MEGDFWFGNDKLFLTSSAAQESGSEYGWEQKLEESEIGLTWQKVTDLEN